MSFKSAILATIIGLLVVAPATANANTAYYLGDKNVPQDMPRPKRLPDDPAKTWRCDKDSKGNWAMFSCDYVYREIPKRSPEYNVLSLGRPVQPRAQQPTAPCVVTNRIAYTAPGAERPADLCNIYNSFVLMKDEVGRNVCGMLRGSQVECAWWFTGDGKQPPWVSRRVVDLAFSSPGRLVFDGYNSGYRSGSYYSYYDNYRTNYTGGQRSDGWYNHCRGNPKCR